MISRHSALPAHLDVSPYSGYFLSIFVLTRYATGYKVSTLFYSEWSGEYRKTRVKWAGRETLKREITTGAQIAVGMLFLECSNETRLNKQYDRST
jgi:hypothetical protein